MTAFGVKGVPDNPEAGTCSPICESQEGGLGRSGGRTPEMGAGPAPQSHCVCLGRDWGEQGLPFPRH